MLTGKRDFQNSRSVFGVSAILRAQETSMINDPAASERVEVNHGKGKAFNTFLLYILKITFRAHHVAK